MSAPSAEAEAAAGIVLCSIHKITRPVLVQLAQAAIDRLDELDGDCDLEDGFDAEERGEDLEYDFRDQPAGYHGLDQTNMSQWSLLPAPGLHRSAR